MEPHISEPQARHVRLQHHWALLVEFAGMVVLKLALTEAAVQGLWSRVQGLGYWI